MVPDDKANEAASCTRAGLLIVVICGLALSLLEPIEKSLALNDLERYISLRVMLAAHLDEVNQNPCVKNKEVALKEIGQCDCFKNLSNHSNPAVQAISAFFTLNNIAELEKARRGSYLAD